METFKAFLQSFFVILTAVTLPVYILAVFMLIKYHKKMQSSFFTLCISTGVADIWLTIHKYVFTTFPRLFFRELILYDITFATMSKMGIWYIYFAQVFGVWLMTLNRYTALVRPMKYKSLWTKNTLIIAIALQWILPLPTIIPQFFPCCYSSFNGSPDSLYPSFIDKTVNKIFFTFDIIMEPGVLAISIVTMYVVSFYKCMKMNKMVDAERSNNTGGGGGGRSKKAKGSEIKLALMGMMISVLYVIMCMTYIGFAVNYTPAFVTLTFYYTSDLFTCINPWALFAFSTVFRKHFVAFIGCKGTQHIGNEVSTQVSTKKITYNTREATTK